MYGPSRTTRFGCYDKFKLPLLGKSARWLSKMDDGWLKVAYDWVKMADDLVKVTGVTVFILIGHFDWRQKSAYKK